MNLFAASGVDLPSSGPGARRVSPRLPHQPLFAKKTLEKAFSTAAVEPSPGQLKFAADYAKRTRNKAFLTQKESQIAPVFYREIMCGLLGYSEFSQDGEYTISYQERLRGKPVDAAIGRFQPGGEGSIVLAPLEMKGPETVDLDKIMPGRGISPVQQAWDYAADAPGAQWVLVSNCLEIRLYGFGRGRETYELFKLDSIDDEQELKRLLLLLEARRLLDGETAELLEQSDAALKDITGELYGEYRAIREKLMVFLMDSADGPRLRRGKAVEVAQKLIDRILFVAFAQSNNLLPGNILQQSLETQGMWEDEPLWKNVRGLFRAVDAGKKTRKATVNAYNGGLFRFDPVADSEELVVPDHLTEEMAQLARWDFGAEVPVTVLGHIFEQSIGDLEKLRAEGEPEEVSQRKLHGVVYTPDHITRFLVEHTVARTLAERFAALLGKHAGVAAGPREAAVEWADPEAEQAFWLEYLGALRGLTIVDPACGSGAFLVAVYDFLLAEYRRVIERLLDFGVKPDFDVPDEILSRNLYGVDLNVESAEITRLSLWLKTARPHHRLAALDHTIRDGNSIIDDEAASDRPFDWKKAFPEVFAKDGFDIVIGNPPYVRMEHLKPVKPWLAKHYTVADERTDLSAYFFERGVDLLKPGGRLGYISTSSFFRAGYGEKLRLLLGERMDIETVTDFGDAQIFEGVTTYPAILTAKRKAEIALPEGELRFLNIRGDVPEDLSRAFAEAAREMPRARLTGGSWQFEDEALARLRDRIVKGRKTLGEVYGAPLYGIKTGLNDAFVIDTPTRDRLVKADPKSAELLKPFLKGENIKRWRVEPEGLWLINTPKGKVDIDAYPAVRDWLLPFKPRLEARATQQEWWELQQAQLAYQPKFEERKISYPHFQNEPMFTAEATSAYSNDKSYFIPTSDMGLLALLNSTLGWSFLTSISPAVRNGWHEMRVQYVEKLPIPSQHHPSLPLLAAKVTAKAAKDLELDRAFHTRLLTDLAAPGRKLSRKLENFQELDFKELQAEIKRALNGEIPVKERGQWQELHAEASGKIKALNAEIAAAEAEIDRLVYAAFDLTSDEIELLEKSLEGQA